MTRTTGVATWLPAERAGLLRHDVLDLDPAEISRLVGKTVPACRKLLERAKEAVAVRSGCRRRRAESTRRCSRPSRRR